MFDENLFVMYEKEFIKRKDIDDRVLLVLAFLMLNVNARGKVGTTLENIINNIGYIPNRNSGKINDIIIGQLKWLQKNKYIFINTGETITPKGYLEIQINKRNNIFDMKTIDSNGEIKTKPHVSLTEREYKKITTSKTKANKGILIRVFLSIKSYISFDKYSPNICFPSQLTIAKNCGLKSVGYTVNNAIKELVKMRILFEHVTGGYKDKDGNVRNANNVYAVEPAQLKVANQIMLDYYNGQKGLKIDKFIRNMDISEVSVESEVDDTEADDAENVS